MEPSGVFPHVIETPSFDYDTVSIMCVVEDNTFFFHHQIDSDKLVGQTQVLRLVPSQ